MLSREFTLRVQDILTEIAVVEETVANEPKMPWHKIRGMRNAVIHEYFRVGLEIVWQTTQSDLPALQNILERILTDAD